jgi:hypothetical protein
MNGKLTTYGRKMGLLVAAAALSLGSSLALAAEPAPDDSLAAWLGSEFTVESVTSKELMPVGGKLSFVFDAKDNVIRLCTRSVTNQTGPWRMDLAVPCSVALTYTRGTHYCSIEDVKAGNAEVLSTCHRLRSHDVAIHPSSVKGTVERNDMVAFLVQEKDGSRGFVVLIDSPSRVTEGGVVIIKSCPTC